VATDEVRKANQSHASGSTLPGEGTTPEPPGQTENILAMMLQRLIVLGDPVPQRLIDYAAHQWRRPSVEQWIHKKRPPLVEY
jgi:hypothetical protein